MSLGKGNGRRYIRMMSKNARNIFQLGMIRTIKYP